MQLHRALSIPPGALSVVSGHTSLHGYSDPETGEAQAPSAMKSKWFQLQGSQGPSEDELDEDEEDELDEVEPPPPEGPIDGPPDP